MSFEYSVVRMQLVLSVSRNSTFVFSNLVFDTFKIGYIDFFVELLFVWIYLRLHSEIQCTQSV